MRNAPELDPIELLRDANPALAEQLRDEISAEDHDTARERAIAAGEGPGLIAGGLAPDTASDERSPRLRLRPGRAGFAIGAALACAGIAAAVVLIGGGSSEPGVQRAFAATAVEVAEANPRLLIGAPGWSVTRADEFERDQGSMEFSDGDHKLSLAWATRPPGHPGPALSGPGAHLPELGQWYRVAVSCVGPQGVLDCRLFERNVEIEVLGRTAILNEHRTIGPERETNRFVVYLPWDGRMDVTINASSIPRAEFRHLLDSLRVTDIETWLAALPPEIVRPLERPEVVDEMLEGVPAPSSVDIEELKGQPQASGRYALGAAVTGAVACGWLDQWAQAVKSGDSAAAQEAVEAMSTSRDWPILEEMHEQGGWSATIWEYADEMRRDDRQALLGVAGTETLPGGRVYELRPSYATGLSCDSERRVLRKEAPSGPAPGFPDPIPVPAPG